MGCLSHKQLNNIVYDDSSAYTVSERHAAWQESYDQGTGTYTLGHYPEQLLVRHGPRHCVQPFH